MLAKETKTRETALDKLSAVDHRKSFFHGDDFYKIQPHLLTIKNQKKLRISVILPTLNEEETIESILVEIHSLVTKGLVDELLIVDGGSSDKTVSIAQELGVKVLYSKSITKEYAHLDGKGVQLWSSLFASDQDIICWIDSDIRQFHLRFVLGLIGPLILFDQIHFVKAFYQRPLIKGRETQEDQGGRVTELCARPLMNLLCPGLNRVIQPLSGEYAFRRHAVEDVRFSSAFGVEAVLLMDFYRQYGVEAMAQVNMVRREHRNKSLQELSITSFMITKVVLDIMTRWGSGQLFRYLNTEKETDDFIDNRFKTFSHKEVLLPSFRDSTMDRNGTCDIYFIRHGLTLANQQGVIQGQSQNPLCPEGEREVDQLSLRLKTLGVTFDQVVCSDLKRCQQTFELIKKVIQYKAMRYCKSVRERDYGVLTMQQKSVLKANNPGLDFSWSGLARMEITNAEPLSAMKKRLENALLDWIQRPGKHLIVTHCGVLNLIYRLTKEIALGSELEMVQWSNAKIYKLSVKPKNLREHRWDFDQ